MKSVNALLAGRIKNNTWSTPMVKLVTPMGMTSVIHQVAARRKIAMAPLPATVRVKVLPSGSTASGQRGEK